MTVSASRPTNVRWRILAILMFVSFVMVIASMEDPAVIQKIHSHVDDNADTTAAGLLPQYRAIFVAKN
jgi:hypothetical protein